MADTAPEESRGLRVAGVDSLRQEGEQEISRFRCRARGTDHGAVVLAQNVEPGADVVGVADGRHDAQRGTDERARHFRDEFFTGVGL